MLLWLSKPEHLLKQGQNCSLVTHPWILLVNRSHSNGQSTGFGVAFDRKSAGRGAVVGLDLSELAQSSEGVSANAGATPAPKFDAGDNAWVLTSAALVLMMTAPGLALFYCGLVRKQERAERDDAVRVLDVPDDGALGVYGYTLVFGGNGPWIGDGRYLFMHGVEPAWTAHGSEMPLLSRADDPRAHPHAVPGDVLHHHAGPDLRGLRGTDEVQHDGGVHGPLGHADLLPAGPLDLGRRNARLRQPARGQSLSAAGPWILPAERWCTSVPACRPWFAP